MSPSTPAPADPPAVPARRSPVTPADVTAAVTAAAAALGPHTDTDWGRPAGPVEWDCLDTAEHVVSDLVAYAVQIAARAPRRYVPFDIVAEDGAKTPVDLIESIEGSGALLASAVRAAAPEDRGYHPYGTSDAEGFAAMGCAEVLLHTADIAEGLGAGFAPDPALCGRVLGRLFPEVERAGGDGDGEEDEPWRLLLWASGRTALPGRPKRTAWRWRCAPLD